MSFVESLALVFSRNMYAMRFTAFFFHLWGMWMGSGNVLGLSGLSVSASFVPSKLAKCCCGELRSPHPLTWVCEAFKGLSSNDREQQLFLQLQVWAICKHWKLSEPREEQSLVMVSHVGFGWIVIRCRKILFRHCLSELPLAVGVKFVLLVWFIGVHVAHRSLDKWYSINVDSCRILQWFSPNNSTFWTVINENHWEQMVTYAILPWLTCGTSTMSQWSYLWWFL